MTGRETPQARPRAVLEGTCSDDALRQLCHIARCAGMLLVNTYEYVRDILVLTEQRQVQENLDGLGVYDGCAWSCQPCSAVYWI